MAENQTNDQTAKAAQLTLDQILKNLSSDGFSRSLDSLVGILNEQGKSKEEIQQMLAELQKRDEERAQQMAELRQEAEKIEQQMTGRAEIENQARMVLAKLDIEIATLKGRLAEQAKTSATLDERISRREDEIERLEQELEKADHP